MKRSSITSTTNTKDQSIINFTDEDIDSVFNTLSQTSSNNCITSNSLSNAYSHDPVLTDLTQAKTKSKYETTTLVKGLETSLKELVPEIESDSIREKIAISGINKKQFKRVAKHFQEIMNTTTSNKERDEIIFNLEKECLAICDNDAHKLIQMLHLSTMLEAEDLSPLIQAIGEGKAL